MLVAQRERSQWGMARHGTRRAGVVRGPDFGTKWRRSMRGFVISCALRRTGTADCWATNHLGGVGEKRHPRPVDDANGVSAFDLRGRISAGQRPYVRHEVNRTGDSFFEMWGSNNTARWENGHHGPARENARIGGWFDDGGRDSSGGDGHTCAALLAAGTAQMWGHNKYASWAGRERHATKRRYQ